jgi:hypothetical protein
VNKTNAAQQEELYTAEDICKIYEYVNLRDKSEDGFKTSIARMYERNARWANPIVKGLVSCVGRLLSPSKRSVRYFFWGTKYKEIILGLPADEVCVIGGPKQIIFSLKHRINFVECMGLWSYFYFGLIGKNGKGSLAKLMGSFWLSLAGKFQENAILIVDNDSLPAQRALIVLFRKFGLKAVCIQHGIFQSRSPGYIFDGWFSDKFLVINEQQREMLISKGMSSEKPVVMGFHSSPYMPYRELSPVGGRKVCFLGQPWAKYGEIRSNKYLTIVERVRGILSEAGLELFYKPHPWEKGLSYLSSMQSLADVALEDAFERFDVFISMTSTALIEAAQAGRISIQIKDDAFDSDDFSAGFKIITLEVDALMSDLFSAINSDARLLPKKAENPAMRMLVALGTDRAGRE